MNFCVNMNMINTCTIKKPSVNGCRVMISVFLWQVVNLIFVFCQAWPQKLREKLESEPENTKLIEDTVTTVLRYALEQFEAFIIQSVNAINKLFSSSQLLAMLL